MSSDTPTPGDLVEVHWLDTVGECTGYPRDAAISARITPGYYVGYMEREIWGCVERYLVTLTTRDTDVDSNSGWDAYPCGIIRLVKVIKHVGEYDGG